MVDKQNTNIKKIIWLISCALMLAIGGGIILATVLGCRFMAVTTGSMEPEYPVGSLIITYKANPEKIEAGDVISYRANGTDTIVTHRVVRVNRQDGCFYTQGDANGSEDNLPVEYANVVGRVFMKIPRLGYIFMITGRGLGRKITVAALIVILVILFLQLVYEILRKGRMSHEKGDGLDKQ
jgi:signal peptidase